MSDWDYIRLLMEQEGLYSYFVPGKFGSHFGDVFQVCDDIDHYLYQPALRVPYRETAGQTVCRAGSGRYPGPERCNPRAGRPERHRQQCEGARRY
ncbi:hypothetical protein EPAKOI_001181 [Cupriavidus sp. H18C2]